MQNKNRDEKIIIIDEDKKYGIGVITNNEKTIDKIKRIKMTYIKYDTEYEMEDDYGNKNIGYFISFSEMPESILKSIVEEIRKMLIEKKWSFDKSLNFICDLFSNKKLRKRCEERLLGDIGEAIFILKCKEVGIEADKYIRKMDNALYDFVFGNVYVEVKSSSKYLNEISITERQVSETLNKVIVVAQFQKLENQENIFSLYKKINSTSPILLEKRKEYELLEEDKEMMDLINSYGIDLNSSKCFIVGEEIMPKIKLIHNGGLKEIKYKIDITMAEKKEISLLKKYINN